MESKIFLLEEKSRQQISRAIENTYGKMSGLRYSEIEVFLEILTFELKKSSCFYPLGFEEGKPEI